MDAPNKKPIPNMNMNYEPSKPLTIVTIPNPITLTSSTNYLSWKTQVEAVLIAYDLHKHLHATFPAPPSTTIPNPAYETWFRQDKLIFAALIGTLSSNLVPLVSQAQTTHEMWDILAKTYDKKPITTKQSGREHINSARTTTYQVIDLTSTPSSPVKGGKPTTASVCNKPKRRRMNKVSEGNQRCDQLADRISNLPDDILVHMLSFVELKTAGRTSLLSKRWRHVWTHLQDLDFEDSNYHSQRGHATPTDSERERYLKWVNKVITASRATHLNSLRIHSPLRGSDTGDINKWVKFAFSKNVSSLELNFSSINGRAGALLDSYRVSLDFLLTNYDHLTRLKSLHFEGLDFDGPSMFENVLAYCLNLEYLTVKTCKLNTGTLGSCINTRTLRSYINSGAFRSMRVSTKRESLVVSSLKLKHLHLRLPYRIESLEIFAPELTTLILFTGWKTAVKYTSVPSLANVTFGGDYTCIVYRDFNLISDFSYRLQKLSIPWSQEAVPRGFPVLKRDSLLFLISFIKACPLLHTFKLEEVNKKEEMELLRDFQCI